VTDSPWLAVFAVIAIIVIALEQSPQLGGGLLALVVLAGLLRMPKSGTL
jgi:hypothetical protein